MRTCRRVRTSTITTSRGLADLRGLAPAERARLLIDHCAHPAYRDYLHRYVESAGPGHIRHDLRRCFELYTNYLETGAMLPDLDLSQFDVPHAALPIRPSS